MLKNVLYKEIKLVVNPAAYLFPLLSALLLIPSYPYLVGTCYFIFAVQISFQMAQTNKDDVFTSMLPIPRNYIVLGRTLSVIYIQALQLLYAVPFALISSLVLNKGGNPVGMDANLAYFGLVLIYYSAFNLGFIPRFFKTGYKLGVPFILGMTAYFLCAIVCEVLIALVPALHNTIDGLDKSNMGYQAIVLVIGIAVYVLSNYLAYKRAAKNYEKVVL